MSPTGDPSTFTFTFDAMPDSKGSDKNLMFSMEIGDSLGATESLSDFTNLDGKTTVYINGTKYETTSTEPKLSVNAAGVIGLTGATVSKSLSAGEVLTNFDTDLSHGTAKEVSLVKGSSSKWYIV